MQHFIQSDQNHRSGFTIDHLYFVENRPMIKDDTFLGTHATLEFLPSFQFFWQNVPKAGWPPSPSSTLSRHKPRAPANHILRSLPTFFYLIPFFFTSFLIFMFLFPFYILFPIFLWSPICCRLFTSDLYATPSQPLGLCQVQKSAQEAAAAAAEAPKFFCRQQQPLPQPPKAAKALQFHPRGHTRAE